MKATMATAEIEIPTRLPFLESISWFDRNYRALEPLDMLRRYEASWRWLGLLSDPSLEEKTFIRELVQRFGSFLDIDKSW
jgi:hypothetical protein